MSNRFYNLESQYNVLRTRETTASTGAVQLPYRILFYPILILLYSDTTLS